MDTDSIRYGIGRRTRCDTNTGAQSAPGYGPAGRSGRVRNDTRGHFTWPATPPRYLDHGASGSCRPSRRGPNQAARSMGTARMARPGDSRALLASLSSRASRLRSAGNCSRSNLRSQVPSVSAAGRLLLDRCATVDTRLDSGSSRFPESHTGFVAIPASSRLILPTKSPKERIFTALPVDRYCWTVADASSKRFSST